MEELPRGLFLLRSLRVRIFINGSGSLLLRTYMHYYHLCVCVPTCGAACMGQYWSIGHFCSGCEVGRRSCPYGNAGQGGGRKGRRGMHVWVDACCCMRALGLLAAGTDGLVTGFFACILPKRPILELLWLAGWLDRLDPYYGFCSMRIYLSSFASILCP
jgi:hypothetical protein